MASNRLRFEFDPTEDDDKLTAWSGLTLVYEVLQALGVLDSLRKRLQVFSAQSRPRLEFDEADYVAALVLSLAAGGHGFDDLQQFRSDKALQRLLERRFPSPEAARQFFNAFHSDELIESAQRSL